MTGYALVRKQTAAGELTLSLRSVNHRGLDLHFYLSSDVSIFENSLRALLKQQLGRGHVEVRISLGRNSEESVAYNSGLLSRYVGLFRQACAELDLDSKPDLNTFFTLPGILQTSAQPAPLDGSAEAEVIGALADCLRAKAANSAAVSRLSLPVSRTERSRCLRSGRKRTRIS